MFHHFSSQASYLSAFTTFLWTCAPFLVAVSSFTAYILIDPANVLDAQTAFVSLTYFNLLRMPLNMLPQLIVLMVQTTVSLRRVNKFMNAEELDPLNVTRDEGLQEFPVFAEQASFTWGSGQPSEVFLTGFKLFLS
jgi:ABC-type multidrug transport system fused ATPase/permease subunit